jgi:orotate phosphoribosyltransferase
MLADYQRAFIELAISCDVLKFGEFTLKSGRISPYFFNAGRFDNGDALHRLGGFYADALQASGVKYDMLFGPAYKGIPLVSATSIALAAQYNKAVPYAFNRKEAKTHGEGGLTVGADLIGDVIIVDDVITAGTAIREVIAILQQTPANPVGVMVAIDRQEKGKAEQSAIQEVESEYGISVVSIVKIDHVVEYLKETQEYSQFISPIEGYRRSYGTAV